MHQFNKFRGTKGFLSLYARVIRFRYMITEKALTRCRILAFWEKHGDEATTEAFGVSRRTLFRWQRSLRETGGKLEGLNAKATAPHLRRKRIVPDAIRSRIITLRTEHPRLGKEKLHALLTQEGYTGSVSTVGRMLTDLKKQGKLPNPVKLSLEGRTGRLTEKRRERKRKTKLRRPRGYRVLEVDTIVRSIDGMKRYIVTSVDTNTRTAFAAAYTNHGSASAADFLRHATIAIPDCPLAIQTDNGSEFALHFTQAVRAMGALRFHTHPYTPKENAHIERFNRSLNEEFLVFHRALLRDDVAKFNQRLMEWLLWYNAERPHHALGLKSPFRAMMETLPSGECQKWWTNTGGLQGVYKSVNIAKSYYGPVAHLVERVIRIDEASGSSPLGSTTVKKSPLREIFRLWKAERCFKSSRNRELGS